MAEKVIGDRTFKVGHLLATDAIVLQSRLIRIIGPALDRLPVIFAGKAENATDADRKASDMAAIQAISDIFGKADPREVADLVKDICELAMISHDKGKNYDQIDFDGDFSGSNFKDTIPVATFVLKETLGDFFSGALASGRRGAKTVAA